MDSKCNTRPAWMIQGSSRCLPDITLKLIQSRGWRHRILLSCARNRWRRHLEAIGYCHVDARNDRVSDLYPEDILRNCICEPMRVFEHFKPCKFICVVDRLGFSRRGGNNQGLIGHFKGKIISLCAKMFVLNF